MVRCFLFVVLIANALVATEQPKRIDPDLANQNLVKKVDPAVPPLAKSLGIGGSVILDVTISPDGRVSSVKVLAGHPMLAPAFVEAVKKWEYKPFTEDGRAIAVVTQVEWKVASPSYTKSEEKALQDYYPTFQTCYGLVRAGKDSDAEKRCSEAVALSDDLPANRIIERSSSRTFLAHALVGERRPNDAIQLYEKALEIYRGVEHSERDADFASDYANLARAYFLVGQLEKADPLYGRSVTIFEAAIVALPDMKENYTARLKSTLLEYAKLKDAKGEADSAKALEQQAAGLQAK